MSPPIGFRAGLLAALLSLAVAELAVAHPLLLESTPQAGATIAETKRVGLRFNSRLEPALSHLRLEGPAGVSVLLDAVMSTTTGRNGLTAPLPPLRPGFYTVYWQVLTVDGHTGRGTFSFWIAERGRDR